jgi:hypothetical protein
MYVNKRKIDEIIKNGKNGVRKIGKWVIILKMSQMAGGKPEK